MIQWKKDEIERDRWIVGEKNKKAEAIKNKD
jgi:hypothetical protein